MPTQDWGVYPDSLTVGTEVSSTFEGRHITAQASELNHGNVLLVVTKGYPVIFGTVAGNHGVGVAFNTELAATDLIAVDTEGIWNLSVVGSDDLGNSLVTGGDPLFINTTTAVISKIRDNVTQIPFGYALGQANGDGLAHIIAVKVHWDPRSHWLEDMEHLYFGDLMDVNLRWDQTDLVMLPLVNDAGAFRIGNGILSMDFQVFGFNVNTYILYDSSAGLLSHINTVVGANAQAEEHEFTQATPTMPDGMGVIENQLTVSGVAVGPFTTLESNWINIGGAGEAHAYIGIRNDGIWSGGDISDAYLFMQKYSYLPDSDANWVSIWELNYAGANSEIDAIFNVNDPTLALGYTAGGAAEADVPIGYCPFFSTAHGALMGYVYIFAHP